MSWDILRYKEIKKLCSQQIADSKKTASDYMLIYKDMIRKDDFEGAKAVAEVLLPLNYDVTDTHRHIKELWI